MTLIELYTALDGLTGFKDKVVYHHWATPESIPAMPFICYAVENSDNFGADDIVYKAVNRVRIELYSEYKDTVSEAAIETMLTNNRIYWEKDETYIDDERCYETIYSIEV